LIHAEPPPDFAGIQHTVEELHFVNSRFD